MIASSLRAASPGVAWEPVWKRTEIGDGEAMARLLASAPFAHMMREGAPEPPPNAKRGKA